MKISTALTLVSTSLALTGSASAQRVMFSTDWQGPTIGTPDSASLTPITAGDILSAPGGVPMLGPLGAPDIVIPHGLGGLGLFPGCVGAPGGTPCRAEVDAFSLGFDNALVNAGVQPGALHFSVDRFAVGMGPALPSLTSESPSGDSAPDVFTNFGALPMGPLPPAPSVGNFGRFDGNGLPSGSGFAYPGTGLIEPSIPMSTPVNMGDNLDALDIVPVGSPAPVRAYFSLDGNFIDPITGFPNLGTVLPYGVTAADVLVTNFGFAPAVFAPEWMLGLGLTGVEDDLDALCLRENGDGIFQPSITPYDWLGGTTDMLLFSVRRGSAVIGMPDSIFGIPIEEGDILTTPLPTGFGGLSPYPGILIAAENIGLRTLRSGTAIGNTGDDLVALDHYTGGFVDCDGDGIDDALAIAMSLVADVNMNGIPDVCEGFTPTCTPLPNSTSLPTLMTASFTGGPGTGVNLSASQGPPNQFGYFLVGTAVTAPGLPIGSGILCLSTTASNMIGRYNTSGALTSVGIFNIGGNFVNLVGTATSTGGFGYDIPTALPAPIGGTITTGSTWHFQLWHRDIPLTSNFSNAISYTF
ncbi:MAG: hypothetical protein R3F17_03190 [Planctomycetota bacterium]